jgi:hemoglobin/transferrin/lactoferrin receptor protein
MYTNSTNRPRRRSFAIALSFCCAPLHAADATLPIEPAQPQIFDVLDSVIVTATMTPRAQKDIAGETSAIDAAEIDRHQAQDMRDLLRYEPGVSVSGDGSRFGLNSISIRGLDSNRVRILVDGIAVPDAFAIGSFSSAGRDAVDVDSLKRVEIVRGAASSLYGSDAIGGVVSYLTKDPSDYLDGGKGQYASLKTSYASVDRETSETGTYAAGDGSNGLVLVATHRDGSQFANSGTIDSADATRTRPNPQDTTSNSLLAKYVRDHPEGRIDRITLDGERARDNTDVLSGLSYSSLTRAQTTALRGDDRRQRLRLSVGQDIPLSWSFADSLLWRAYAQRSKTTQDTFENRATVSSGALINPAQRYREFTFDQDIVGVNATAQKSFTTGAAQHELTYGVDVSRTHTEEERNGYALNLTTGVKTNVVPPDTFPTRDFPLTNTTTAAWFGQDEIALLNGRLSLIPGLRVDYYDLDPERNDATFAMANPGVVPTGLTRTSWSPKFGAIWRFSDELSAYLQYAHGFRAPPYNDVNVGFTNLQFGYTALPNPNLKPETSDGVEIGLRGTSELGYFSVSAYDNRYRDFINELEFVGIDPSSGLVLFQSVNLTRVRIRGAEARAGLKLDALNSALAGFTLKGSLAYARGDDESAHQPLASIDPARAVIGLAYDQTAWGAELFGTFSQANRRLAAAEDSDGQGNSATSALFHAPGWSTLDFYAHWQAAQNLQLYLGLTNLTDHRYWRWGDVRGAAYVPATVDRYSAPPRAISMGLKINL